MDHDKTKCEYCLGIKASRADLDHAEEINANYFGCQAAPKVLGKMTTDNAADALELARKVGTHTGRIEGLSKGAVEVANALHYRVARLEKRSNACDDELDEHETRLDAIEKANTLPPATEKTVGQFTDAQVDFLLDQGWHQTSYTQVGELPAVREFVRRANSRKPKPVATTLADTPETLASVLSAMDPDTLKTVLVTAIVSTAFSFTALTCAGLALRFAQ